MTDLEHDLAALRIERVPERRSAGPWIAWVGVLIVAFALGLAGWRWIIRERPVDVQVAAVSERAAGTQAAVLNASGYVTARRRATVSSKVTGKVVEVNVEEGMNVREGQLLARLDDSTQRAALALAVAQAEAARRGLLENDVRIEQARLIERRVARLFEERIVTQADMDQAKADADALEAHGSALREQILVAERQIELQQTNLDDMVIRAPFSGVAISRDAQPGEMVSPVSAGGGFTRTGISTIVDMTSLEIEVDVNESYINRVTAGQDVIATLDAYPDWEIPARVITLVPSADRQKATILVRIGFVELDPRILPDMAIKVNFLRQSDDGAAAGAHPTALAPKAAIVGSGNASVVFVVRGERVERRAVTVGGGDGDRVEVLAGLQAGDRVVLSPPPGLADGAAIVVR